MPSCLHERHHKPQSAVLPFCLRLTSSVVTHKMRHISRQQLVRTIDYPSSPVKDAAREGNWFILINATKAILSC